MRSIYTFLYENEGYQIVSFGGPGRYQTNWNNESIAPIRYSWNEALLDCLNNYLPILESSSRFLIANIANEIKKLQSWEEDWQADIQLLAEEGWALAIEYRQMYDAQQKLIDQLNENLICQIQNDPLVIKNLTNTRSHTKKKRLFAV